MKYLIILGLLGLVGCSNFAIIKTTNKKKHKQELTASNLF